MIPLNRQPLRDALAPCAPGTGYPIDYCRGVFHGVILALVAAGRTREEAGILARLALPMHYRLEVHECQEHEGRAA